MFRDSTKPKNAIRRVSADCNAEMVVDQTLGNHVGKDWRILHLVPRAVLPKRSNISISDGGIGEPEDPTGDVVAVPESVVGQRHCLVGDSNSTNGDIHQPDRSLNDLPIAVFDVKMLIRQSLLIETTSVGRPEEAAGKIHIAGTVRLGADSPRIRAAGVQSQGESLVVELHVHTILGTISTRRCNVLIPGATILALNTTKGVGSRHMPGSGPLESAKWCPVLSGLESVLGSLLGSRFSGL